MTNLLIIGFCLMVFGYTRHISGSEDKALYVVGILLIIIYWLDRYIAPLYVQEVNTWTL